MAISSSSRRSVSFQIIRYDGRYPQRVALAVKTFLCELGIRSALFQVYENSSTRDSDSECVEPAQIASTLYCGTHNSAIVLIISACRSSQDQAAAVILIPLNSHPSAQSQKLESRDKVFGSVGAHLVTALTATNFPRYPQLLLCSPFVHEWFDTRSKRPVL